MVTAGGKHEPMPFTMLVDMIERHSYRQHHIAYSARGVKIGLPPDVVTIMFGEFEDMVFYNCRKGYVPEKKIVAVKEVCEFEDMAEIFDAMGMPDAEIERQMRKHTKKIRRVQTNGWRDLLRRMISESAVRPNEIAEEWLGSRDYDKALAKVGREEVLVDG